MQRRVVVYLFRVRGIPDINYRQHLKESKYFIDIFQNCINVYWMYKLSLQCNATVILT